MLDVVDTDVHMSSGLSISSNAGRGLSEQGDCSRDIESKSSSLITVPIFFFRQKLTGKNVYKLINRPQSNALQRKAHERIHHGKPPLRPPPLQKAARTRSLS